jgi:hypothetical protein
MAVTCSQFVAALSAAPRAAVLSAELQAHAARCSGCLAVWKADELLREAPAPRFAGTLPEELQRALRAHRGVTRTSSPWLRALAVSAACALSLMLALVAFPRPDLRLVFQSRVLPSLAVFAALMAVSLAPFLYRGRSGLGLAPSLRWLSIALSFAAFHVVCVVSSLASTETGHLDAAGGGAAYARTTPLPTPHDCLALGLITALCILGATFAVSRQSALIAPRASGALAGASAGFGALLMLQLHCPSQMALHLHIVHALPLVLSVALGSLAGRRWLAA